MDAIQILLEGAGDVLFLKHLLSKMEPSLVGKWKECLPITRRPPTADSQIRDPNLTYRVEWKGLQIVLRANRGVKNIFSMPSPLLLTLDYGVPGGVARVLKNVFIVDADSPTKLAGTGGIAAAKKKITDEVLICRDLGVACAGFAFPTNESDGTLEDLLSGMIPVDKDVVVSECWARFKACVKTHGAIYEPSLKTMLDVYAKLFSSKVQGRIFIGDSYSDEKVWDWNAPILNSLKSFLRKEILDCQSVS